MSKPENHIIFTTPRYHSSAELFKQFDPNIITDRYATIYKLMSEFIDEHKINNNVYINPILLGNAILDYFEDLARLKIFHNINQANSIKCNAYQMYWILRRKVLQLTKTQEMQIKDMSLQKSTRALGNINERFILQFICNYLSIPDTTKGSVITSNKKGLKSFVELLLYYLTYREFDAQNLEIIMFAFYAGQIYENTDNDISKRFHPHDKT